MPRMFPIAWLVCLLLSGCFNGGQAGGGRLSRSASPSVLRLAVTTSTRDTGLLDVLNPVFEKRHGVRLDVIAVGTGAALNLGESGDVDAVLVHSREAEDAFMAGGHGVRREDVMYNTFQILGPDDDPGEVRDMEPISALRKLAADRARFVSRGDDSGTHKREKKLWEAAKGWSHWDGYMETGQGMGATLLVADQMGAYVLCDSGTYLKFKEKIRLVPLVVASQRLRNPYGVIVVNPRKHPSINADLAEAFVDFIISAEAARLIDNYKIDGRQLFFPGRPTNQN